MDRKKMEDQKMRNQMPTRYLIYAFIYRVFDIQSINQSINQSISQSINQYLSVCLSVCLSIYLSI